jgi:acetate kinase
MTDAVRLLTINTGSSSLKAALYQMAAAEQLLLAASAERIGLPDGRLHIAGADGATLLDERRHLADHAAALELLLSWLRRERPGQEPQAVGHRVVHGGAHYSKPHRVTPSLIAALVSLVPLAPGHLPQAVAAIRVVERAYPGLPQVACFDTAFHRQMLPAARTYPLPEEIRAAGVIRYGFHGLSYEYILQELRKLDRVAVEGRVIVAHLGNGASMAAVRGGVGLDTTMGFTPAGGLVMGTRSGDLDPGVLLYLLEQRHLTAAQLSALVNERSGLLGVSGTSGDMRELLEREATDPRAAEAIELFCFQARKFLGALTTVLGGLDTLVFTGGIGEHAAPIRRRICANLEFLGIRLDDRRNAEHAPVISADDSAIVVRVMRTDEDVTIARHTHALLTQHLEETRVDDHPDRTRVAH